jgi:hypothetical protein
VTDTSLIPVYDEIRNHMGAIEMIREMATRRRFTVGLEVIKKLFAQLVHRVHDALEGAVVIDPRDVEALLILLAHLRRGLVEKLLKLGDAFF